jgi:hypothetical protein
LELTKTHGTEPINVIGIEWVDGNIDYYADKNYNGIKGSILELGDIDEVLKLTTGSPTFEVSVVLDDFDGDLLSKLSNIDLQKRNCYIYQTFDSLAVEDMFLIFQGEAVTPIEWDECERKLKFNILSEIDSEEVGFSPEEGQFEFLTDDAVGKVWPLCFGDVVHVPATKSSSVLTSVTTTEVGYADATLVLKYNELLSRLVKSIHTLNYLNSRIEDAELLARDEASIRQDYLTTILQEDILKQQIADKAKEVNDLINIIENEDITVTELAQRKLERNLKQSDLRALNTSMESIKTDKFILGVELDNAEYKYQTISNIREKILDVKSAYVTNRRDFLEIGQALDEQDLINTSSFKVLNGDKFPQNTPIQLEIKGLVVEGSFNGDLFTITEYLPKYTNIVVGKRQTDDPNSFWIQNPGLDLNGYYVLTNSGHILKVVNQIGNRCYVEVQEASILRTNDDEGVLQTELDLTTWLALENTSEHTTQEKERILEQALGDDVNGNRLLALRTSITKRVEALAEAQGQLDPKTLNTIRLLIFRDMYKYNVLISKTKVPLSAQQKVNQKISKDEEEFLLRVENLIYAIDRRSKRLFGISVAESLIDGYLADGGIAAASPIMFPSWLKALDIQESPPSTLWVAEPGTTVKIYNDQSETYVANILPSTVHAIYAKRSIDGILKLVPVPSSYYTLYESVDLSGLTVTGIKLHRPLSDYANQGWTDGLYVSLSSSVGPNTADIIKYIIETYTDVTVDSTSYNSVRLKLENYPSNFALFDKRDALSLVEDIAWQARCLVYVKNKTLYFKYLSDEPVSVKTLTYDDVEEASLNITYTDTGDIYTKLTATWQPHYDVVDPNKSIIRHNIAKYKSIEFERDFFIYNIQSLVEKSLTFWAIRYSNSWKQVQFKTFLTNLELETWDCVTLDFQNIGLSNKPVKALIESADYSSTDNSLNVTCWVPVRAGTMEAYDFAFPANLDIEVEFPTEDDIAGGNAGNPNTYPNNSNGNDETLQPIVFRPKDFGGQFPGDQTDSIPVSPISGLNQVNYRTYNIQVNKLAKDVEIDEAINEAWGFNIQGNGVMLLDKRPFRGYVSEVISTVLGTYKIKDVAGREMTVNYETTSLPLTVNQIVVAIYDDQIGEWSISPISHKEYIVKVVTVSDDLLDCITLNGDLIKVAKPYLLRRTPFDNKTYNGVDYAYSSASERVGTQTIGGKQVIETQIITPDYVVDDIISIKKIANPLVIGNDRYHWEDKNTDSRAWAVKF